MSLRSGGDGEMVTPVPIPNTEVKHFSGDYSYACHSETSSLPGNLGFLHGILFYLLSLKLQKMFYCN
jgi:hypothetical protein